MNFQDKRVLVTGSSRGIGRAAAIAFAELGAKVVVHYNRNQSAAQETLNQMAGTGHLLAQADIAKASAVKTLFQTIKTKLDGIDIVVNNAGIFDPHPIDEVDYSHWQESWQKTIATNLIGAANVCYCAAELMIPQKTGRIINVSSRGAFRGEPEFPAYGASKAGIS